MEQNYSNHRRIVPMYHYIASLLTYAVLIGSLVNLYKTISRGAGVYSASLIVVMAVVLAILHYYVRIFPLKAQDRAIRVEENLRHYGMTGKLLDPKLTIRQIIGLRFASDEEFLELEKKAASENLSEKDIKRAIKNWRADNYRV
ncbi:hypothetical protein GWN42_09480 [candidate division KSB1 bacterium]|nr:hypothetical protein [candidate division KSB1 bacterium]